MGDAGSVEALVPDLDLRPALAQVIESGAGHVGSAIAPRFLEKLLREVEAGHYRSYREYFGQVRQQIEGFDLRKPFEGFPHVAELCRTIDAKVREQGDGIVGLKSWSINEAGVVSYRPGSIGITPHLDGKRYRRLVVVASLTGTAEFALCSDRKGNVIGSWEPGPGSLTLLHGPGLRGAADGEAFSPGREPYRGSEAGDRPAHGRASQLARLSARRRRAGRKFLLRTGPGNVLVSANVIAMPDLVAVMAEPNRRRLLELLSQGEQSVSQLAAQFGVTRSAISQHLLVLASAGLVQARQEGRFRYYRLDPGGVSQLREALDMFWTKELEQLAAARPPIGGDRRMSAEKTVLVPLGPDETFALLTEPERLRRWQAVTARVELRAGGEYRWTIIPGHTAAGTFTEIEPGKRIAYTWGWEDAEDLPPGTSTVTVTLEPVEGGTNVRLVHSGLTPEQAASHLEGWNHYAERLVLAGESGDAGPDEWIGRNEPSDILTAAEASLAVCDRVLRGLEPSDATLQTPCAKYNVDELVEHLLGSIRTLGEAAGASVPAGDGGVPEVRVADASQATLEAWRKRGLDGTVKLGPTELPATIAADILTVELLVHAWDLAAATDQELSVGEGLSGYVLERARGLIAPHIRDGDRFSAELEAGPDADNLARLVAFTGRSG